LAVRINAYRALGRNDDASRALDSFLETVPVEQAGGMLAVVARGMQEQVERLEADGDAAGARDLARQSLPTFVQLLEWVRGAPARAKHVPAVSFGLAQMYYLAGEYEEARSLTVDLLQSDPRDGSYQRLNALVLTAALGADASQDQIVAARDAWGTMLRDPTLRSAFPERYWESRYHFLELMVREGRAGEAATAIRQERVWYPELGGPGWRAKLEALLARAEFAAGEGATTAPTPASRPAGAVTP
jgi:predicted Zn-dependent protease